ncbi:MAG: hypothetical protein ACXVY5_09430, partial [Gaiellales bacterium]
MPKIFSGSLVIGVLTISSRFQMWLSGMRHVANRLVLLLALDQLADLVQRPLLGHAWDVVRARERHLGHRRGLGGQRAEILRLQAVDVGLA